MLLVDTFLLLPQPEVIQKGLLKTMLFFLIHDLSVVLHQIILLLIQIITLTRMT
ncbi:hypothetical protein ACJX0J_018734, partial [Zea mays]